MNEPIKDAPLEPCPFCGTKARETGLMDEYAGVVQHPYDPTCFLAGRFLPKTIWNRRAGESRAPAIWVALYEEFRTREDFDFNDDGTITIPADLSLRMNELFKGAEGAARSDVPRGDTEPTAHGEDQKRFDTSAPSLSLQEIVHELQKEAPSERLWRCRDSIRQHMIGCRNQHSAILEAIRIMEESPQYDAAVMDLLRRATQ